MNDVQWNALRQVLEEPHWMSAPAFQALIGRLESRAEIDERLARETARYSPETIMTRLQAQGVAAGMVQDAADVMRDPQLRHRCHWVTLAHTEMGPSTYNAPPFRCLRTPVTLSRPAPLLGEHTREVCRELLGLSDTEVEALVTEGLLT